MSETLPRIFLGLGANLGAREDNLRRALAALTECCTVVAISSLYRSVALVIEGEEPGPDYLNAACEIATALSPRELLAAVKRIEHDLGRRPAERWAPREIDIDILLYGAEIIDTAELQVPHPGIKARNFVLLPLAELAPEVEHPRLGRTVGELAGDADFAGLEHVAGPEWAAADGGGPSR